MVANSAACVTSRAHHDVQVAAAEQVEVAAIGGPMPRPVVDSSEEKSIFTATVITEQGELLRAYVDLVNWASELHLVYAWASSGGGSAPHWAALDLKKVRKAVIGTHFAQTEPAALAAINDRGVLKVIPETAGVFHPKVLLGTLDGHTRAIVGSSNFTGGGFGKNTEINVLLEGLSAVQPMQDIIGFVNDQWNRPDAGKPTPAWLKEYERRWRLRPRPPAAPPLGSKPTRAPLIPADVNVDFDMYYDLIADQDGRRLKGGDTIYVFDREKGSYLQEAEACRAGFRASRKFAAMPRDARRLIGGWGEDTTGFFGSMRGAGRFMHTVLAAPATIAKYLDKLPLTGKVETKLIGQVLGGLVGIDGISIGTASRLLTVKRPDLFLSVNNANRAGIKALFGGAPWNGVGQYLALHDQLWALPWFNSDAPEAGDPLRVWRVC
jgi:hypothetical protein